MKHEVTKAHVSVVARHKAFLAIKTSGKGDISHQVASDSTVRYADLIERNQAHVKVILDIVLLCTLQDIPLRGHREYTETLNKGNFLELFKFICK